MPTYTATREDDGWAVRADGELIETARAGWDADQVLLIAEAAAGQPLAWKLTDDGFESIGPVQ